MISRRQKRQELRKSLDELRTQLSARDNQPQCDLDRLTIHERQVFDALCEKSTSEEGWDFSKISYEQKKNCARCCGKAAGRLSWYRRGRQMIVGT